jgi:hypothetical protein
VFSSLRAQGEVHEFCSFIFSPMAGSTCCMAPSLASNNYQSNNRKNQQMAKLTNGAETLS